MSTFKTTGIILHKTDYAEADRIYTILTPERKLSAIARGVRKSSAKLASHLELCSEIELMAISGRRLDILTSARVLRNYELSHDYERLRRGFLLLEMANRLSDTEGTASLYGVVREGLSNLAIAANPAVAELGYKLRLLAALGSVPDLTTPDPLPPELGFDVAQGKLGAADGAGMVAVESAAITLWRLLLLRPLAEVERVKGVDIATQASLPLLDQFIAQQFGVRFISAEI